MFRLTILGCAVILSAVTTPNVMAACTYQEAVIALEKGNPVRGLALMQMAAKDGDKRAIQFLGANEYKPSNWNIKVSRKNRTGLIYMSPEAGTAIALEFSTGTSKTAD